jgi:signal transduction histidine kinase/CheY-like chemotaxis protein
MELSDGRIVQFRAINCIVCCGVVLREYCVLPHAYIDKTGLIAKSEWPFLDAGSNFFDHVSNTERVRSMVQAGSGGLLGVEVKGIKCCVGFFPHGKRVVVFDLSTGVEPEVAQLRMMGKLTTKIAHDFNNLLTGTMGFCELLELKYNDREVKEIHNNTQRAVDLVKQILDWARPMSSAQGSTSLYKALTQMQPFLDCITGSNIEVKISGFKYARSIGDIDLSAFEQVITNLVTNARDSITGRGVIEIQLSKAYIEHLEWVRGEVVPGSYLIVRVQDTGHGISRDKSRSVFDQSYSTKSEGTGQGLSIIADLLFAANGFIINLPSTKGALFEIGIPAIQRAKTELSQDTPCLEIVHGPRHRKVLVVEDDCSIRSLVSVALRKAGYKVSVVNDISAARKKLELLKFDLVVTDSELPDGNGLNLIKLAKKYGYKLLVVSGYPKEELSKELRRKFEFLPKPFTLRQLLERVNGALEES